METWREIPSAGLVLLVGLAVGAAPARADIAAMYLDATPIDGCGVLLQVSYSLGWGGPPAGCDVTLTRYPTGSDQGTEVYRGDLGRAGMTCTCGARSVPPSQDATANGEQCTRFLDLDSDWQGTCPTGYECFCTAQCHPFVDHPPEGEHTYAVLENATWEHEPTPGDVASVTVEGPECAAPDPDAGPSAGGRQAGGCGCQAAPRGAHLLVLLLFLLGLVLPAWWQRRRGR